MSLQLEPAKLSPWQRRDSKPRLSGRSIGEPVLIASVWTTFIFWGKKLKLELKLSPVLWQPYIIVSLSSLQHKPSVLKFTHLTGRRRKFGNRYFSVDGRAKRRNNYAFSDLPGLVRTGSEAFRSQGLERAPARRRSDKGQRWKRWPRGALREAGCCWYARLTRGSLTGPSVLKAEHSLLNVLMLASSCSTPSRLHSSYRTRGRCHTPKWKPKVLCLAVVCCEVESFRWIFFSPFNHFFPTSLWAQDSLIG